MNNTYNIDLKYSLWSNDKAYWDEQSDAPYASVWNLVKSAYNGDCVPVTLNTAPGKEIRFGQVTISKGHIRYCFYSGWDELHDVIPCDLEDDQVDALLSHMTQWLNEYLHGFHDSQPVGAHIEGTISEGISFAVAMTRLDEKEQELIKLEQLNSALFDSEVERWFDRDKYRILKRGTTSRPSWEVVKSDRLEAFQVDAMSGTINHLGGFSTKRAAQQWIDSGFPLADYLDCTHITWGQNIHDAARTDKQCVLYVFPQNQRLALAKLAESLGLSLFCKSSITAMR